MINPNDKSKIIERIKCLFALGDSTRNPHEEEVKTALRMAQKMMKKYNLSISEIDFKNATDDKINQFQTTKTGHLEPWKRHLGQLMKILYNVEPLMNTPDFHKRNYIFVGFEVDCKLAIQTYDYLHDLIDFKSKLKYKGRRLQRQAYLQGLLTCLLDRAIKETNLNKKPEDIKYGSLVVVKGDRINKWISENIKVTHIHCKSESNLEELIEYSEGYEDGKKIKLGNKKELK